MDHLFDFDEYSYRGFAPQEFGQQAALNNATPSTAGEMSAPAGEPPKSGFQTKAGVNCYPHWETSYTKRVCDKLAARFPGSCAEHAVLKGTFFHAVKAAYDLLKDYHQTQHVVYEERDSIKRELDDAKKTIERAHKTIEAVLLERDYVQRVLDRERIQHGANNDALLKELSAARAKLNSVDDSVFNYQKLREEIANIVVRFSDMHGRDAAEKALASFGVPNVRGLKDFQLLGFLQVFTAMKTHGEHPRNIERVTFLEEQLKTVRQQRDDAIRTSTARAAKLGETLARIHALKDTITSLVNSARDHATAARSTAEPLGSRYEKT